MSNNLYNRGRGSIRQLYANVLANSPAGCALLLVPLETTGLATDAALVDLDTLADILAGTSNEQTTLGRKVLVAADLAALAAPDDANNRAECSLPTTTWAAAAGNPISKILVCYRPAAASVDSAIIPLTDFDYVYTPSGVDMPVVGGVFYRSGA